MPRPDDVPVQTDERGDQTHPSFACVRVSRAHGSPRPVFQSDLTHTDTIRLQISRASRSRDLSHDYLYPRDQLVEIEMSMSQWASLVSSIGGGEVPVTLNFLAGEGQLPATPYAPRLQANVDEVTGAAERMVADIKEKFEALEQAETARPGAKLGVKERRRLLNDLHAAIWNTPADAAYTSKKMARHAEAVVDQMKADVETMVTRAQATSGQAGAIGAGSLPVLPELDPAPGHEDGGDDA